MPFLHWDTEENQTKRAATIDQEAIIEQESSSDAVMVPVTAQVPDGAVVPDDASILKESKEQSLLKAYLRAKHPLHIRRTLDQYYYHAIESTKERDSDQVASRYQEKYNLQPKVMTVVDQLWLWVLPGDKERVDTVITCFPQREKSRDDPDLHDSTDVLRNIKQHIVEETSSIKTAFDLASLIASKCSRAYLDIARMNDRSGFSEMYELAISEVVSIKQNA